MPRGRKRSVSMDVLVNTILKYKNDMLIDDKIVSKTGAIWQNISEELSEHGHIKATSLYTFVVSDKYNLRQLLGIKSKIASCNKKNESIQLNDTSLNDTSFNDSVNTDNKRIFTISLRQREYQSLLVTKVYKNRVCVRFKDGEWEDIIAQKIWNETRIQCGINFKGHYLTQNADYGHIDGKYIIIQGVSKIRKCVIFN